MSYLSRVFMTKYHIEREGVDVGEKQPQKTAKAEKADTDCTANADRD